MDMLPEPILCHILSFLPTKTAVACGVLSKRWKLLWTLVPVLDLDEERDMPKRPFYAKPYICENLTSEDLLSKLPDRILLRILVFLPTKTSVTCTVLSKRWKLLWADRNLVRDMARMFYDYERPSKRPLRFLEIVDNVYFLSREIPVKKLRLCVLGGSVESCDLHEWILACRFEELHLSVRYRCLTFPTSFRSNMVVLKLTQSSLDSVESCLFPKLRVLHLLWVSFHDHHGGSLENFLAACPVLEDLECRGLRGNHDHGLCIRVPTLTSLVLQCEDYDSPYRSRSEFVLETRALEYLSCKLDATRDSLVITSLGNICKADIICLVLTNDRPYGCFVVNLLKNLSIVRVLKLSFEKMSYDYGRRFNPWQGLVDKFDYSCLEGFPVYDNLIRLELSIPSCDCVLLPRLLQKFHNLKHISINKVFDVEEAEVCWEEPLLVPICLSSTLSSFCFQGFEGFEVEVELIKCVTKHAKVLKNLTVEASSDFKIYQARVEAAQELPMVMRGSEACQFSWFEN